LSRLVDAGRNAHDVPWRKRNEDSVELPLLQSVEKDDKIEKRFRCSGGGVDLT
jgi:hypothetical protein